MNDDIDVVDKVWDSMCMDRVFEQAMHNALDVVGVDEVLYVVEQIVAESLGFE